MNEESVARLQAVFRAVFSLPATYDISQVQQVTEQKWDSLAHVMLVTAIESEFNVTIDASDALRMTSYSATRQLLEESGL